VKQTSISQRNTRHPFLWLTPLILLSSLTSNIQLAQTNTNPSITTQIRTYKLNVSSSNANLSTSYYGRVQIILNSTESSSYLGLLSWNLTWDNGRTWYADCTTQTYSSNRTYTFAGINCSTAWWINPAIQLGDQIPIDGDLPATNNFLRIAPFTVTDLISVDVNYQTLLCWQLSYTSGNRQHEIYYYEYHTGALVQAKSLLEDSSHYTLVMYLELQTATPPLPSNSPILHYWVNYNSLFFSFIGATFVALLFYLLLRLRLRHHSRIYH
jgi:hypothetical protein